MRDNLVDTAAKQMRDNFIVSVAPNPRCLLHHNNARLSSIHQTRGLDLCWIENQDGMLQISGIPHKRRQIKQRRGRPDVDCPRAWLQEGKCERELKDESLVDGDGQVPPEAPTQSGCNIPSARVGGGAQITPHHMAYFSFHSAALANNSVRKCFGSVV